MEDGCVWFHEKQIQIPLCIIVRDNKVYIFYGLYIAILHDVISISYNIIK